MKKPRLFYFEEAIGAGGAWTPVPEYIDGELICVRDQLDDGDTMEIRFKRIDMTDEEFDNLPED